MSDSGFTSSSQDIGQFPGMTLRDYLAAKAMAVLPLLDWRHFKGSDLELMALWAKGSYFLADAMLAERVK